MNKITNLVKSGLIIFAITFSTSLFGAIVYDNSINDPKVRFDPGTLEIGDEITLAGTERNLTQFDFEYWGTSANNGVSFAGGANVKAQVRFYLNNGPASSSGPLTPGTMFYDSGLFTLLPTPPNATGRQTLIFVRGADNIPVTGLFLPNSFTWSVQFSGLGAGDNAGVDIYRPVAIGSSFPDYWEKNGAVWTLKTNASGAMNFAARFQAVPDVTSTFPLLAGVLALFFGLRFRKR